MPVDGATVVSVLRHGEVAGRAHVYRGSLDDPLTEAGWTQMRRAVAALGRLGGRGLDAIAASPASRCSAFAGAFAAEHGLALALLAGMREMAFGAWEGLTPEEAARRWPREHRRFGLSAGGAAPPGGESFDALRRRVRADWAGWLAGARGGHRLLVTHAGVMRALLVELLGLPPERAWRFALPAAASFQVSILPGAAPVLLCLNPCAD